MTPNHANESLPQPPEPGSPEPLSLLADPLSACPEVPGTNVAPNTADSEEIPILPVISSVEPTDNPLDTAQADAHASSAKLPKRGTLAVLCGFACFLLIGIFHSRLSDSQARDDPPSPPDEREMVHLLVEFEGIDTMLVLVTFAVAGRPPRVMPSPRLRATTWLLAPFVLILLLALNFGYIHLVRQYVGKPPLFEYVDMTEVMDSTWLIILLVCVQPGVVEELFFRYLTLGHFRNLMGNHGAVWTSAVLFGAAHIYNPVGLPSLIVVGAGLGYLRLYSGSLLLPMLAHGVHNGVVLAFH